ncbi:MAG TPA: N-methyl-L-tryptophan oxidase [Gemmatimonadaceae bacterium]|nr:N-methyl-L-tryptophan oxidase [Gemmatimonadaceae bacterium]
MTEHDVIVVGAGAMGSAAAWRLAARGARVLAIGRWSPPHAYGSTHGRSRIIREAYYEHPCYVPLVRRAYELWAELERESGQTLFRRTGGLMVGPPDGALVSGAKRSAVEHALPHEELDAAEIRRRFPGFAPETGMVGVWEPRAGVLHPEMCVRAMLDAAAGHGAVLLTGERVVRWIVEGGVGDTIGLVTVETDRGAHRARSLVLTAGAWLPALVRDVPLPLEVERQLLFWFEPLERDRRWAPERAPVALWEYAPERFFYTFPDLGDGVKMGIHHEGEIVDPDAPVLPARPEEEARARALMRRFLPGAAGAVRESVTCLYTDTPDRHFLIDRHPNHERVILASPCSGHGFKFAPAIGDLIADLCLEEGTAFPLTPFSLSRFFPPAPRSPAPSP